MKKNHDLYFNMYPIKVRIGIGVGKISTDILEEQALGADGPAYHEARRAIEWIPENENRNASFGTSIKVFPESSATQMLLNLSFAHYSELFNS